VCVRDMLKFEIWSPPAGGKYFLNLDLRN
jgi:hypothetical protein